MATVNAVRYFPEGTTVGAFPASRWRDIGKYPEGAPLGTATEEADVTSGVLTFDDLADNTEYLLVAEVGTGNYVYVRIVAGQDATPSTTEDRLDAAEARLDVVYGGWPGQYAPYWPFPGSSQTLTLGTDNRGYYARFVAGKNRTITKIGFNVTTAADSDVPCSVALYNAAGTTRLAASGAVTGKLNSAGFKPVDLTAGVAIVAGTIYYAGFSVGASAGVDPIVTAGNVSGSGLFAAFGTDLGDLVAGRAATQHPLPTTIPVLTEETAIPLLAILE